MASVFKRVVLKIGGEVFCKQKPGWFDISALNFLVEEIKMAYAHCKEIVIIPGGGNIMRGRDLINLGLDRRTADWNGMLATCLNGSNLRALLKQRGLDARLQIAVEMKQIGEPYISQRAIRHLEKGRIVIIAGGLGVPEFTTDTAAVIRAIELDADAVLKMTMVDGIYDRDPNKFKKAKFLPVLTYKEAYKLKIQVFDSTTIAKAEDANLPIIVFQAVGENLVKVLRGFPKVGSLVAQKEIISK